MTKVGKQVTGRARAAGPRARRGAKKKKRPSRALDKVRPASSGRAVASRTQPAGARAARKLRAASPDQILQRLARAIPEPHVELAHANPWQLLIAVILSAQSTDRRVNLVTPELFQRWPSPTALAAAPVPEVEDMIRSTGFFRNKTKAIRGASQMLVDRFAGEVPRSMEELLEVPGVARKTANVVLGAAYGVAAGIVTDTHAMRVAQRLGLTRAQTPEKIEADLCRQFPRDSWIGIGHRLVLHGRYVCTARSPKCAQCPLNEVCPSRLAAPEGDWELRARDEADDMAEHGAPFRRAASPAARGTSPAAQASSP